MERVKPIYKVGYGNIIRVSSPHEPFNTILASFDPGDTTGVAIFVDGVLEYTQTLDTRGPQNLPELLQSLNWIQPTHITFEDFRLYPHTLKAMTMSKCNPVKVIGVIELYAYTYLLSTNIYSNLAANPKHSYPNKRIKEVLGLESLKGVSPHALDAIRHGLYTLRTKPIIQKES